MQVWKKMGREERREFLEWVLDMQSKRWDVGSEKYDSENAGFQGQPLEHLAEELFDALCYCYYAMRQRHFRGLREE